MTARVAFVVPTKKKIGLVVDGARKKEGTTFDVVWKVSWMVNPKELSLKSTRSQPLSLVVTLENDPDVESTQRTVSPVQHGTRTPPYLYVLIVASSSPTGSGRSRTPS